MTETVDYWIEQVLSGQSAAFASIVRRYQMEVWRIVARVLHSGEAADNLVQQVFVDVYTNLDRFEMGRDFGVWLRAIVRNRVRMELRRLAQEDRRLAAYRDHLAARLDDSAADEREQAYLEALQACRKQLPERSARLIEMRYVCAMGFEKIAELEGGSPGAVQRTLARIRLLLRDCIKAKLVRP